VNRQASRRKTTHSIAQSAQELRFASRDLSVAMGPPLPVRAGFSFRHCVAHRIFTVSIGKQQSWNRSLEKAQFRNLFFETAIQAYAVGNMPIGVDKSPVGCSLAGCSPAAPASASSASTRMRKTDPAGRGIDSERQTVS